MEINETLLFTRKYNRGRVLPGQSMVFGGISRKTRKVFGFVVPNQMRDTLYILHNAVDRDTYVVCDQWRAYAVLVQAFSGYRTVKHSEQFLNPPRAHDLVWVEEGHFDQRCLDLVSSTVAPYADHVLPVRFHTQTIESALRVLKKITRHAGGRDRMDDSFGEWMYRQNILSLCVDEGAQFVKFWGDLRQDTYGRAIRKLSVWYLLPRLAHTSAHVHLILYWRIRNIRRPHNWCPWRAEAETSFCS